MTGSWAPDGPVDGCAVSGAGGDGGDDAEVLGAGRDVVSPLPVRPALVLGVGAGENPTALSLIVMAACWLAWRSASRLISSMIFRLITKVIASSGKRPNARRLFQSEPNS